MNIVLHDGALILLENFYKRSELQGNYHFLFEIAMQ